MEKRKHIRKEALSDHLRSKTQCLLLRSAYEHLCQENIQKTTKKIGSPLVLLQTGGLVMMT